MITFETDVRIGRPLEEVFAYISEPLNFPHWNSAVRTVRKTSAGGDGAGSTYVMERELPIGQAINRLHVVASEPPGEFAIRATAGPTPFLYRYRCSSEKGETVVKLDAEVELPPRGGLPPTARPAHHQERSGRQPRGLETNSRKSPVVDRRARLTARSVVPPTLILAS